MKYLAFVGLGLCLYMAIRYIFPWFWEIFLMNDEKEIGFAYFRLIYFTTLLIMAVALFINSMKF